MVSPRTQSYSCWNRTAYFIEAGIPLETAFGSKTSVYTGCFTNDWQQLCFKDSEQSADYAGLGVEASMNANRISWFFNFTGTSVNVDSACSSSLIALDLACKGLINGDMNMVREALSSERSALHPQLTYYRALRLAAI